MDEKNLIKKFHDKHFLRKNEFAEVVAQLITFVKANKPLVSAVVVLALIFGLGLPTLRWYKAHQIEQFNTRLFEAEKSLKKVESYEQLLQEYKNIPASQLARLELVETLVEHNQAEEAATVLDEGLKHSSQNNIFSTLLVLKRLDLLKAQNKYLEAVDFATNHRNQIIKTYLPQYKLLQANLLLLADKKDEARTLYQQLIAETEVTDDGQKQKASPDSSAVRVAKEQLMLLDLGVL